jgi:hypothetical protein
MIKVVDSRPNVWQMQSRHDTQGLIKALRYPDPEVRGRAAVALRTLNAIQAVPALHEALQDELDEQARKYIQETLHRLDQRPDVGQLAQDADIDGLIEALKSARPETMVAAARALGKLGNRLAVEPLVILFNTSTSPPAVRLAAAEALLELKSAPAVVTLLGALRRDSWQVRRNAAAVLGQLQAIWAVEPLAAKLKDPHPVVRRTAAAALKRIGTAEAVAALRKQLGGSPIQERLAKSKSAQPSARRPKRVAPAEARKSTKSVSPVPRVSKPTTAREKRFDFDSVPAGLTLAGGIPSKRRDSASSEKFEVERGEIGKSHTTHPSEATRPVTPISRSDDAPGEVAHPQRADAQAAEDDQRRNLIDRMITFLRRRDNS